ncbi:Peptidoglycan-recognition protein [Dermatophagoides pteronyssinus]|uniref:Peptidoglycan-recognition protein n=1 Tax=Dermatophagoides pteronyssinus TaxID=6956 RepID=A0ABQ8JGD7_DERPT|nr:Peptidoglycan-recognition protein [Dermatophagoides pteronyssinus]
MLLPNCLSIILPYLFINIINGQILDRFIDNLACRRTSNNGIYGECMPRRCCRSLSAVRNLCLTSSDHICCYGDDICNMDSDYNRRFPTVSAAESAIIPVDNDFLPNRGMRDYCNRFMVTREDWGALPPIKRAYRMPVRVDYVIVHHTGDDDDRCWSLEQCRQRLRRMQSYYQHEKQFPDIPWNFLINNQGDIYEGVGWDSQGYHTEQWNDRSLGIAFIGDYDIQTPSTRALRALTHLLDCGVEQRVLDQFYRLRGHRDMRTTNCPGDYLYDALRRIRSQTSGSRNRLQIGIVNPNDNDDYDSDDEILSRSDMNNTLSNKNVYNNQYSDLKNQSLSS